MTAAMQKLGVREIAWVARQEFVTFLRRRSFLFTTLAVPLFGLLVTLITGGVGVTAARGLAAALELQEVVEPGTDRRYGYVDPAGFVLRAPPDEASYYQAYPTESDARAALDADEVDVVFLIPQSYPTDRTVRRIGESLEVRGGDRHRLNQLLRANLWPEAGADELRAIAEPGQRVQLAVDPPRYRIEEGGAAALVFPILVGVLLYSAIFTVSSYLLQSVTTEKENRVLEILLTSVRPFELLLGKVIGLGALGLFQLVIWAGVGAAMFQAGSLAVLGVAGVAVGLPAVAMGFAYFALGYFFYASVMASIGALAPSLKESGPLTLVVLMPAWTPFLLVRPILSDPQGILARTLTLLPPTAPLVGLIRVSTSSLGLAEAIISLALLAIASVLVLAGAARLFRASILLTGSAPSPLAVMRALRHPAHAGQ